MARSSGNLLMEDCPQTNTKLPSCKENKKEVVRLKYHPGPLTKCRLWGIKNCESLLVGSQDPNAQRTWAGDSMAGLPVGWNNLKLQHVVVMFRWMRCWKPERLYMGCDFCWQDTCTHSFNLSKILRTEMDLKGRWVRKPSVGEATLGVIKRNYLKIQLQKTHTASVDLPRWPQREVQEISLMLIR